MVVEKKAAHETKKGHTRSAIMRAPDHKKYYVTNVTGGLTSQDFRFELMNERLIDEQGEGQYVSDATIILSAIGAKRLAAQLNASIKEYEKTNGEIPLDPPEDKAISFRE